MTNKEFIVDIMEQSQFGILSQLMVIQGLYAYAQRYTDSQEPIPLGAMIDHASWHSCAKDIMARFEKHYHG